MGVEGALQTVQTVTMLVQCYPNPVCTSPCACKPLEGRAAHTWPPQCPAQSLAPRGHQQIRLNLSLWSRESPLPHSPPRGSRPLPSVNATARRDRQSPPPDLPRSEERVTFSPPLCNRLAPGLPWGGLRERVWLL